MSERGKIQNRDYAQQIRDFSGLRYGAITPTDIDAFMDFGGKVFIFIESKHGDTPLKTGQRLALERLCDASASDTRRSYLLIVRHHVTALSDVDMSVQAVTDIYFDSQWRPVKTGWNVKRMVDWLLEHEKVA